MILKQALTRHSSVNSSTYNISPLYSPTSTDTDSSNSVITPPNTSMSTSEGESNSGSTIDVQDSITDWGEKNYWSKVREHFLFASVIVVVM